MPWNCNQQHGVLQALKICSIRGGAGPASLLASAAVNRLHLKHRLIGYQKSLNLRIFLPGKIMFAILGPYIGNPIKKARENLFGGAFRSSLLD